MIPLFSNGPRAVVFDLDGTLVDTEEIILRGTRHAISRHLTQEFTDDELWALYGRPVQEVWYALSPEHADDLHTTYLEFLDENRHDLVRAFPGVFETLQELARREVRLALLSNKLRPNGLADLEAAGLGSVFEVMAFYEDMPHPKPDASGLLAVLEALRVPPEHALMVGDTPPDILCGRHAGVPTGLALWARQAQRQRAALEQLGPTYLFTELAQLLRLFPTE